MTNYEGTAFAKEIAARLRGYIARYDVSQVELALLCGVSQSQFSKIIRGTRPMSVDHLSALCDALGLDMYSMIREVEAFLDDRGTMSSPLLYVDEGERLVPPWDIAEHRLDPFGLASLNRLRKDVPASEDDDLGRQSDYDRVAHKRPNPKRPDTADEGDWHA